MARLYQKSHCSQIKKQITLLTQQYGMAGMINEIVSYCRELAGNHRVIVKLANRDFRIRYSRNYLGLLWAVVEPMAMLIIMLLVFTFLRTRTHPDYPFVVFLLSGLVAFDFFSKGFSQATNSMRSFSFMINVVHIRTSLLPIISIFTTFRAHLIILGIAIIILLFNGVPFSGYWFQLPYFMLAAWMLLTGLAWMSSALVLFIPDLQYIISISMRALFFLTPVFWDISIFPEKYHWIVKINPLFHLVEGYRMCLLYHEPFWSDIYAMISFWIITLFFLFFGSFVFKRLRPYFADVTN